MHVPCGQNKVEAVLCLFFPFTSPSLLNLHLWLLQIQKHFFLSVSFAFTRVMNLESVQEEINI